jgi:hypothetical protein
VTSGNIAEHNILSVGVLSNTELKF